jgi:lipoprotein-releasing system permease protein
MPFEWFMALRFLREGRMQTALILAGVSFGVAVMVFLAALINGLQKSLIEQTLSVQAHVVVRPTEESAKRLPVESGLRADRVERSVQRRRSMDQYQTTRDIIERVRGVVATAPTVAGSAFAHRGMASASVALRGIEPESYARIVPVTAKLVRGSLRLTGTEAVIGTELADDLGADVGDRLRLVSSEDRSEVFTVSGIFDLGNKDVNQRWVFVSLRTAQTLLDLPGRASTIEVVIDDVFSAETVAGEVRRSTGLVAESWMTQNRQLLIALSSQSSSSVMIQFFVVLAVALGIASVLVVSVVQKSREIGILRATGTSVRQILRVFLIEGAILGLLGSLIGCGIGAALALLFAQLAKNPDGSPTFPVDLNALLFARSLLIATAVGLVAAVAPARRAAKLDPAVAIHHG